MSREEKLQRAIPTPIVRYEKPVEEPFVLPPPPLFSPKRAKELEEAIPTARIAAPIAAPMAVPTIAVPVAKVDRYTGTSTTYKEVVKWRIEPGVKGELKEVSMVTDNYTKTKFKLTIAGTILFVDKTIQAPLSLPFPENRLPSQTEIVLDCKSTDGTSITVDGSITGRELV